MIALFEIEVSPFGQTIPCEEGETILDAALRNKRLLRYGCGHGGCGTCKVTLVKGEVDQPSGTFALDSEERARDVVLACSSRPLEDCAIDVSAMELTEDEFLSGDTSAPFATRLDEAIEVCAGIYRVRLRVLDDEGFRFTAGQFVNVVVPGTDLRRSYSMANAPDDSSRIELYCKTYPGGAFSEYLTSAAAPGDEVTCVGPYGLLKLRTSHRPILMVAGGSGLGPLLSILRDIADRNIGRPVALFFGARTAKDLYATDDIADLERRIPGFTFVPVLSESWDATWTGETGLVTDAVARRYERLAHDVYLCGPPGMVQAASELVVALGSRPRNVYFDAFLPAT